MLTQVPIYLVEIKGVYLENALVAKLISVMYKSIIAGDIKPDNESIKAYIQLYSDYEHY